jgi:hypothetical protein
MQRLLVALLAVGAAACVNAQSSMDLTGIAPAQTAPLSATPGCGGEVLEPSLDTCMLQDTIKKDEVHEYTFTVPPRSWDKPFSILLTAKSVGGLVEM